MELIEPKPINTKEVLVSETEELGSDFWKIKLDGSAVNIASEDYQAYEYDNGKLKIYLSFDCNIREGYSLENFRRYFDYVKIYVTLPGNFEWQSDAIREIKLNSFENEILSGAINTSTGKYGYASARKKSGCDFCCMGECDEVMEKYRKKGCWKDLKIEPVHIDFSLKLPDPELKECKDSIK